MIGRIIKERIKIPFNVLISQIETRTAVNKELFLKTDLTPLKKSVDFYPVYVLLLVRFYGELCFCTDADVKQKFVDSGLPLPKLKWMISLNEIVQEIKNVEIKSKIIFLKPQILASIDLYLKTKIRAEIFDWNDKVLSKKKQFNLNKYYANFFDRLMYGNGRLKRYKNKGEILFEKMLMDGNPSNIELKMLKIAFLSAINGRTEKKILSPILLDFYYNKMKVSQRQLFSNYFQLFRLFCKDKELLNENQFEEYCTKKQKKEEFPYDRDYETYKYEKLKEWILKK